MKTEEKILSDLIEYYTRLMVRKVVHAIRRLPEEAMCSGDDSPLKTIWDEVCVQIQHQYFFHWDLYDDMIFEICLDKFNGMPIEIQRILTYAACERQNTSYEFRTTWPSIAAEYIRSNVYQLASDYSNKQISDYLDNSYID
jgi:hypothetical protein